MDYCFSQLWGKIVFRPLRWHRGFELAQDSAKFVRNWPKRARYGPNMTQDGPPWALHGRAPKGKSRLVSVILGVSCWTPKVTHPEWVTRGLGSQRPMGHLSGSLSGSLLGQKTPNTNGFRSFGGILFFDRFDGIVASSWPKIVPSWSETGPREPDMVPI